MGGGAVVGGVGGRIEHVWALDLMKLITHATLPARLFGCGQVIVWFRLRLLSAWSWRYFVRFPSPSLPSGPVVSTAGMCPHTVAPVELGCVCLAVVGPVVLCLSVLSSSPFPFIPVTLFGCYICAPPCFSIFLSSSFRIVVLS